MKIKIIFFAVSLLTLALNSFSQNFTKVTTGIFVNDGGASRSVNFIDYDGDGILDLFVSNGKRFGQNNFLYKNSGGVFTKITGANPVIDSLPYDGASWADIDNDGDPDLCVVTWYDSTSMFYINNGGGNFSLAAGNIIVTDRGFSETCSWGDYDNDGLVDLIITNSDGISHHNRLYKNTGAGNFTRIDSGAVYNDINRSSRGVNWVDIDGDRKLDLYITNEANQNNLMYKNNGAGYFTKINGIGPTTSGGDAWSSSWGDYDNDGDLDLFTANRIQQNFLFRNDGNFNFTRITNDTLVNETGYFACTGWGDYDNDGDLDMFITQAYKTPNSPLKNNLYKNMLMESGIPSFQKVSTGDIVNDAGYSYGFSWGDWDSDGDLDIFIAKTYGEAENNAAYTNDGYSNKWLEVRCIGRTSNRSAIGAKIKIKSVINGNPVWQMREIDGQSGYCGQNLEQHFGLGNSAVIDSIKVEWPSGSTSYFTGVSVNQRIIIDENDGIIGIKKINENVPDNFYLGQNYPNPFNPVTKIKFDVPANGKGPTADVKISIYDVSGRKVSVLVNEMMKPGSYEAEWNAANYSSGIYFYILTAGSISITKKMMLVK
jgi:hypothetical protein